MRQLGRCGQDDGDLAAKPIESPSGKSSINPAWVSRAVTLEVNCRHAHAVKVKLVISGTLLSRTHTLAHPSTTATSTQLACPLL